MKGKTPHILKLVIPCLLLAAISHAQGPLDKYLKPNNSFGMRFNRIIADSGLTVAADTSRSVPDGSIAFLNHKYYFKDGIWSEVSGNASITTLASVASVRSTAGTVPGYLVNTSGYYSKGDGGGSTYYWDDASTLTDDGIFVIKPTVISSGSPGRWRKVFAGRVNIKEAGLKSDGTDQTSTLNALATNASVKEVLVDNGSFTISGAANFKGKKLVIQNGAMLIGSGSIDSLFIEADPQKQIFSTTLNTDNAIMSDLVTPVWWGATADYYIGAGTYTDNSLAFKKATHARKNIQDGGSYYYRAQLYIPAAGGRTDGSAKFYRMDTTWVIDASMEVYGDGMERTSLFFKAGQRGIWINRFKDTTISGSSVRIPGARQTYLHDMSLYSGSPYTYDDQVADGIYVTTDLVHLARVLCQSFSGNGIHIVGNAGGGSVANNCYVEFCRGISNNGSGLMIDGADANNVTVVAYDGQYNGRWGIWNSSFLGILTIGCHTAANGEENQYNLTAVTWNPGGGGIGTTGWNHYYCIQDNGPGTAHPSPVIPGETAGWDQFWELVSPITVPPYYDSDLPNLFTGAWKKYNTSTGWKTGGGYYNDDGNQYGGDLFNYSETGNQHNLTNLGNTQIIGGFEALYGGFGRGVQGMQNGFQTWTRGQFRSPEGTNLAFSFDHNTSLSSFGADDIANSRAYKWIVEPTGTMSFAFNSSGGGPVIQYISPTAITAYRDRLGLTGSIPVHGAVVFPENVWFGKDQNITNLVPLGMASVAPTTGEWPTGAFLLYAGTDASKVGFRCVSGGSPGTWVTVTAGGGGGGGADATAYHQGGDAVVSNTSIGLTTNTELDIKQNNIGRIKLLGGGDAGRIVVGGTDFGYNWNQDGNEYHNGAVTFGNTLTAASFVLSGTGGNAGMATVSNHTYVTGGTNTTGDIRLIAGGGGKAVLYGEGSTGNSLFQHTAVLQSGTTTMAPLQWQSGSLLSTLVNGTMEYNGTHIYITIGGNRYQLDQQSVGGGGTADTLVADRGLNVVTGATVDTIRARNWRVDAFTTDVGNIGTGEDNLMSIAIDGKLMVNEGDGVEFTMAFNTAANANAKTIKIYFGLTSMITLSSLSSSGGLITVNGKIVRNATGGQRCILWYNSVNNSQSTVIADLTESMASFLTLKATGTGVADNDIVQKVFTADFRQNDSVH